MARFKRPIWLPDDQVREQKDSQEFTDDGRKVTDSDRVGGMAPDADPEHMPPNPPNPPRRTGR